MKFNWGTGIFVFYTAFAIMLITMVIKSTGYDHSLVEDNYYAEDLAYQATYEKMQNSLSLQQPTEIKFNNNDNTVTLQFSKEVQPKGVVIFYRPDNKKLDLEFPIQTNAEGLMTIPADKMIPGIWKIKADWKSGGKAYLDTQAFHKKS